MDKVIDALSVLASRFEAAYEMHSHSLENSTSEAASEEWIRKHTEKAEIFRDIAAAIRGTIVELRDPLQSIRPLLRQAQRNE